MPLMRGTIENGFELTGPIARGDWATVEAHKRAIQAKHPELDQLYETLAERDGWRSHEDRPDDRRRSSRLRRTGLVPTMGALHDGHRRAAAGGAAGERSSSSMSLFVNPAQFDEQADLAAYPRDEARDLEIAEAEGVDVLFAPARRRALPAGLRDLGRPRRDRRRGRGAPRPLPRRRHRLPEALRPRPPGARVLRPEGRAAGSP